MFYGLEFKYITHKDRGCLWGYDIHYMKSNNNFDDCNKWCANNMYCGGYITHYNRCYFKNRACKKNLYQNEDLTAFIQQGNFIPNANSKCIQVI